MSLYERRWAIICAIFLLARLFLPGGFIALYADAVNHNRYTVALINTLIYLQLFLMPFFLKKDALPRLLAAIYVIQLALSIGDAAYGQNLRTLGNDAAQIINIYLDVILIVIAAVMNLFLVVRRIGRFIVMAEEPPRTPN